MTATLALHNIGQTFEFYGHTVEVIEVDTDAISHFADGTPAPVCYRVRFTSTRPGWLLEDTMVVSENRLTRPAYQPRHAAN